MQQSRRFLAILLVTGVSLLALAPQGQVHAGGGVGPGGLAGGGLTLVASGLDHPKGLAFAPDGSLYVAESGHSNGTCPPPTPTRPVTSAGRSGALARIAADGTVSRVLTDWTSVCAVGDYIGPSGVAFTGTTPYLLQGGCIAQPPTPLAPPCSVSQPLWQVLGDNAAVPVAQFVLGDNGERPHPVAEEDPYAITRGPDGNFYVADGGNNVVWKLGAPGAQDSLLQATKPLVQFPGNPVPTGLQFSRGGFLYVALFGHFPFNGGGSIARVMPDGKFQYLLRKLTAPIGVAFSPAGTLYVLQYAGAFVMRPFPHFLPDSGAVWRLTKAGVLQMVLSGLNSPTAMTFGPNGKLYITNNGTGPAPTAEGQVVMASVGP